MALNITYGNDIQLRLLVTRDSAPFPIELATEVQVNIVSIFNRRIPLEFQISDGAVYVTVKALSIGTYGIEVKGLLNKFNWRTYADAAIVVTSATKAGDTSVTVASDAYDVTMEASMYAGTLPLNNGGTYVDGISVLKGYFYTLDGSTYLALVNSPTTAPSEASDEWALLARKGHDFSYSDFTPEQISALQKPATDALAEMNTLKTNVETSEATRVENENGRVTNEATRVTDEATRVTNENGRVESEQARATAEQARVTDENTRLDAETLRDTQEGQRVTNEQQRTTDEAGRVTAENGRVSTETARTSAETARTSAETTRVSNENTRISNEQARVTAEASRQAALNAKENSANKQNSLTPDGTGTKFPTVDAVNAGLAGVNNLIASYTHSGNKEVAVTAVDLATGTFTANGHGLKNGDMIFPILNLGYLESTFGIIRPLPTGLLIQRYFVVEATTDTFKISVTSGGTAVTFTTNVNLDLTAWHFERRDAAFVTISNITEKNTRIVFTGWNFNAFLNITPAIDPAANIYFGSKNTFTGSGTTVQSNGSAILTYEGYVHMVRDTRIGNGINSQFYGVIIKANTASANTIAALDARVVSLYYSNISPTSVVVGVNNTSNMLVNGTEIKIYKL